MRLFIAVDLDGALRQAVGATAARLRREIEKAGSHLAPAGASWVAPGNLHLTLRFLGDVDEPAAGGVRVAVAEPFAQAAFDMDLAELGVFPPAGKPRVAWIGVSAGAGDLASLHGELEGRLARLGFPPEGRPFRAHLTIARFREPAAPGVREIAAAIPGPRGSQRVREVVLYDSRLSPRGAVYTALARGSLRAEGV